jgi:ParB-like chromosome segregation protein Spo0J
VNHVNGAGSLESASRETIAAAADQATGTEISRRIATVPVAALLRGESPRLGGEDEAHIARLAEAQTALPPILVDRRTMRVIDGLHRLRAAVTNGRETVDVEYFDGSAADAFLKAVEANVRHGLPLSRADRRAAAARIIASHPHMSDRRIAESAGLSAKAVAGIRQRSTDALPQSNMRLGRDDRLRPLDRMEGRRRAAELLTENPDVSLREAARRAGVSPATVHDVRKRLGRGDAPEPARSGPRGCEDPEGSGKPARPKARQAADQPAPVLVLEKLLQDPSLRHHEQGRQLLRWLRHKAVGTQEWHAVLAAVPPHCTVLVAQLARQYAQEWWAFAQELNECTKVTDHHGD